MSFRSSIPAPDLEVVGDDQVDTSSVDSSVPSVEIVQEYKHDSSNFEQTLPNVLEKLPADFKALKEGFFTWHIDDIKKIKDRTLSDPHRVGDYNFRMIFMPIRGEDTYSLFLEARHINDKSQEKGDDSNSPIDLTVEDEGNENVPAVDTTTETESPTDWSVCVQFAFDAWDPANPSKHYTLSSHHRYTSQVVDWGFRSFLRTRQPDCPVKNGALNLTAYFRIIDDYTGVLYHDFLNYDSKKHAGYVGFINQGATCYLNSLLQSYFFTKVFRQKVYEIPTEDEVDLNKIDASAKRSVPLALQRVFYNLQTSNSALSTNELTTSFGWDSSEAFTQHDVQELNRILMDTLETKMKNTDIEGCLTDIFVGKMKSFIRCVNVDYESSRIEDYWDIQLNVKDLKNIKQSFENYVELEMLTGENKYDAASFGLQDAEKGVVFEEFPPVLHIQLKRFEYDFQYDQLIKINDRYEFFDQLDLKPYMDKSSAVYDENWEYQLHGVLVHQGDVSMGHYYALIKPSSEDKWYKFDDDRVTRATHSEVFEQCFGADKLNIDPRSMTRNEQMNYQIRRQTSAYMLVYMRKSKLSETLFDVPLDEVPKHISLQVKLEKEKAEREEKERLEMPLYALLKVFSNKTFTKYQGYDYGPNQEDFLRYSEDLVDSGSHCIEVKILKSDPVSKVFEVIAQKLNIDPNFSLWPIEARQNQTLRTYRQLPYSVSDVDLTVNELLLESDMVRRKNTTTFDTYKFFAIENFKELNAFVDCYSKAVTQGIVQAPELGSCDGLNFETYYEDLSDKLSHADINPDVEVTESEKITIFIKYFDDKNLTLKGITTATVPSEANISVLVPKLKYLMRIEDSEDIVIYEEIGGDSIQKLDLNSSFYKSELVSGDILCFARASSEKSNPEPWDFSTVLKYYEYLYYRLCFNVVPLEDIDEDEEDYVLVEDSAESNNTDVSADSDVAMKVDEAVDTKSSSDKESPPIKTIKPHQRSFDLWFPITYSYDDLAQKIGTEIQIDPNYLRLFIGDSEGRTALSRDTNFTKGLQRSPKRKSLTVSYEILNVTLKEFEEMRLIKVYWVGSGICREQRHEFMLPRDTTIGTIVDRIQGKVGFSNDEKEASIFVYTSKYHKFLTYYDDFDKVADVNNFIIGPFPLVVDFLRDNTEEKSQNFRLMRVFQFFGKYTSAHGIPFIFELVREETFDSTRARLQKYLGLGDKEFQRVKICLHNESNNHVDYIDNDELILFDYIIKAGTRASFSIGLDHPDRNLRRGSAYEPAISIKS